MNAARGSAGLGRVLGILLLAIFATAALAAPWLAPGDPFAARAEPLHPPSVDHPLGTDDLGRDVFAAVVHGTRASLAIGFLAAAIAAAVGLLVGGLAGVRDGTPDLVLMRATEVIQAIPRFFLVVIIVSIFGGRFSLIALVIGLTSWPAIARVFRAQVRTISVREFVLAARAAGATDRQVLLRHVLPAAIGVVSAQVSYQAGGAILVEAGLSFLGLGDPTLMSWGAILGGAQQFVRRAWWISLFPGIALTLTVLACNFIADSLTEP